MIADVLLRMLGNDPTSFPRADDKWAAILADTTDLAIPFILILLFLLPFIIVWFRKKHFTVTSLVISLLIGSLLVWGGYTLNEWSYGYGLGIIAHEINK